jgi:hypothetical protein
MMQLRVCFLAVFFAAINPNQSLAQIANLSQTISEKDFKDKSAVFVVNGVANFSATHRNQNGSYEHSTLPDNFNKNKNSADSSIGNDTQLVLKSAIKTENKSKLGASARVEFNVNSDGRNEAPNLDRFFIFSEPIWHRQNWGNFELGNNIAANQQMKISAGNLARGAGGINGKYLEYVNLPMLSNSANVNNPACNGGALSSSCANIKLPRFIMLAQSPIGHGGYAQGFYKNGASNDYETINSNRSDFARGHFRTISDNSFEGMEDATKLSYFTPKINGFKLGLSYAPNTSNQGFTTRTSKNIDEVRIDNIVSAALSYSDYFDNLGIAFAGTLEKGNVRNRKSTFGVERSDLFAYDFGLMIEYFGFKLAGSYGSWNKSLQAKNGIYSCDYNSNQTLANQDCSQNAQKYKNPFYYTAGISYQFGPVGASVTNISSQFQKNKYQATSFDLDYKLRKNLTSYLEVTKFAFKSNQPNASDIVNQGSLVTNQRQVGDNQGYVFLIGSYISF